MRHAAPQPAVTTASTYVPASATSVPPHARQTARPHVPLHPTPASGLDVHVATALLAEYEAVDVGDVCACATNGSSEVNT